LSGEAPIVNVVETFVSIQGESTWAGLPCFFIRLGGCNLRCVYCDTPAARVPGRATRIEDVVAQAVSARAPICEITGGEPLLQDGFGALANALCERTRRPVLVETNGSLDLSAVPERAIAIMDVKCPGSGAADGNDWSNIARLRPHDEVKFVLCDEADYAWAAAQVRDRGIADRCRAVHFSPVHGLMDPSVLGGWIVRDRLPVRLHLQLHKIAGMM
jgi:7-carboxy-7-deazaguanine synthase